MILSKAKGQERGFIFTNRTQSEKGILSSVLSITSFVAVILSIYKTYKLEGNVASNSGAVGILSVLFSLIAFVLGIIGMREADSFKLFPIIGLFFSILSLFSWGFIIYIGVS